MGGFIIDAENSCNQCGRVTHDDESKVTWECSVCHKLVCRYCCVTDPSGREILVPTFCSKACHRLHVTEATMLHQPIDDD